MTTYLVHTDRQGNAMGIFNSDGDFFYFAANAPQARIGVALMQARGHATTWGEWVDSMTEKVQSRTGFWVDFQSEENLEDALVEFSRQSSIS